MTNSNFAPYPFIRLSIFIILAVGAFVILRPFLHALVWASVVAVTAWPLNVYLRRKMPCHREAFAAATMTILLITLILGVVIPFSLTLTTEVTQFVTVLRTSAREGNSTLTYSFFPLTWINEYFRSVLDQRGHAKDEVFRLLDEYQPYIISFVSFAARGIWGFLFNVSVTIFSAYFFFRYGDVIGRQLITAAQRMGGEYYVDLVQTSWATVRAVVFGVVGAAICQGILAGIGYYVGGVPLPVLLGVFTIILGLVPIGPPLLYLPIVLFMLLSGAPWYHGVGLAVWCIAVVSTVDNIVRPFFISQATDLPILLAFFGGIGGIAAFGVIGLFVGPVVLALAHHAWLRQVALQSSHVSNKA